MSSDHLSDPPKVCGSGGCIGSVKLSDQGINDEFQTLLADVWKLCDERKSISIEFMAKNWGSAMSFLNAISLIAESKEISHHPGTSPFMHCESSAHE